MMEINGIVSKANHVGKGYTLMFKFFFIFFFILTSNLNAEIKDKIIQNLKNTSNLDFKLNKM